MREILFRGKTTENRWVEGTYFKHDTVKVCFSSDDPKPRHLIIQDGFCDWGFEPPIHCVDVAPDTVGQFTGKTDKNGKRIFEGDVVRFDSGVFVVRFYDCRMGFGFSGQFGRGCVAGFTMTNWEDIEVIGNIHDNPELLGSVGDGN